MSENVVCQWIANVSESGPVSRKWNDSLSIGGVNPDKYSYREQETRAGNGFRLTMLRGEFEIY